MQKDANNVKTLFKDRIDFVVDNYKLKFAEYNITLKNEFRDVGNSKSPCKLYCAIIKFEIANPLKDYKHKDSICKEYSFVLLKKKGREQYTVDEEKTLHRIISFLNIMLKKVKANGAQKICKKNVADLLKFLFLMRYAYKEEYYGIATNKIVFVIIVLLACIFAAISYAIRYGYYLKHGHFPLF